MPTVSSRANSGCPCGRISARPIRSWELGNDQIAKPPKGTTHVVLDTPAGLHGKRLKELLKRAHKVMVPLQPSVFDIFATRIS